MSHDWIQFRVKPTRSMNVRLIEGGMNENIAFRVIPTRTSGAAATELDCKKPKYLLSIRACRANATNTAALPSK